MERPILGQRARQSASFGEQSQLAANWRRLGVTDSLEYPIRSRSWVANDSYVSKEAKAR